MNLYDFCQKTGFSIVCGDPDSPFEFSGVYAGDFLSRAMSKIDAENLWITVMTNNNVIAVASLTEASAVILAEGVKLLPDAAKAAEDNGITVLSSEESAYNICVELSHFQEAMI